MTKWLFGSTSNGRTYSIHRPDAGSDLSSEVAIELFDPGTIGETFRHFEQLDVVIVGIGAIVPEVKSMPIGSG